MRYQYAKPWKKRAAFTLIEILVVIAIIAILASLILAGVMGFLYKGPEARLRNDILGLSTALNDFHAKNGFYPPDKIRLHANYAQYNQGNALDKDSLYYIAKMWPNLGAFTTMAWAGPTAIPVAGFTLQGDQSLVFFLGGIPDANGKVTGFSTNPKNPTQAGGDRKKYYDFEAGRLTKSFHGASPFPDYLDPFLKKPYVYFSSGRRPDGYSNTNPTLVVAPYIQTAASGTTPAKYWNSTTFQIIAAGLDGNFGPGGLWPSTPIPTAANDDYSNFHDRKLGSP